MSQTYSEHFSDSEGSIAKRRRLDTDDSSTSSHSNNNPPLAAVPPPFVDSAFRHRWKLQGRALISNAADTRYFAKNKSLVFHFLDVSDAIEDEVGQLKSCTLHCGICQRGTWRWSKGGKSKGSTSNMNTHMKEKHTSVWQAANQSDRVAWGLPLLDAESGSGATGLATAPESAFNLDEFWRRITRWIVIRNHPFTEVESEDFCDAITYARPALQDHLVRAAAIKDRIEQHAEIARQLTKQHLNGHVGLMAIACDAWTSSNRNAFLAITGSWITSDWRMEESLLDFVELHGAHDGENMANAVAKTISELGIANKIVALVSDNASNNGTLVKHLSTRLQSTSPESRWDGSKGHIRCLPHIIHLAVMALLRGLRAVPPSTSSLDFDSIGHELTDAQAEAYSAEDNSESLEIDEEAKPDPFVDLQSGISKIRKIARIVRSSPQRMELYRMIAERIEDRNGQIATTQNRPYVKKRVKNLILDVVTRWNSTYLMLERALEFSEAIDGLTSHPTVKLYRPYALSKDDWAAVSAICKWLKFFRGASQRMAGEKYPTLSFSLRVYHTLIAHVLELEKLPLARQSLAARNGLNACKAKLLEFFDQSTYDSEYYYFAMILDPRLKDSLFKAKNSLVHELFSEDWVSDCSSALLETYDEFYKNTRSSNSFTPEPLESKPLEIDVGDFDRVFELSAPQSTERFNGSLNLANEIRMYLAEPLTNLPPLEWWRANATRFPRLAAMARDFLCIPGSSVAVERVLSTGRDVISLRRASLTPDTIRTLMNYRADILLEKSTRNHIN